MKVIITIVDKVGKPFNAAREVERLTPEVLFDVAAAMADAFGEDCTIVKLTTERS